MLVAWPGASLNRRWLALRTVAMTDTDNRRRLPQLRFSSAAGEARREPARHIDHLGSGGGERPRDGGQADGTGPIARRVLHHDVLLHLAALALPARMDHHRHLPQP